MKLRTWVVVIVVALAMLTAIDAHAQRTTAFISDVHLGLGRTPGGDWHPYEDFRWSSALKGFLDAEGMRVPLDDAAWMCWSAMQGLVQLESKINAIHALRGSAEPISTSDLVRRFTTIIVRGMRD